MDAHEWNAELEDVFANHRLRLCKLATRILGPDQADDVVQDAYLKVSQAQSAFAIKQPLAYACRVVRNLAIDRQRRCQFESTLFRAEEQGAAVAAPTGSPEAIEIDRQAMERVVRALDELPERTRRAFELYRMGGHTQREVAEQLGVSTTLVNFMIRDALSHCRDSLQTG
ncbi:RNA polymerase sigma-70 factor (ECF subfamily) [Chromohalobacter marismortui]|uniref:RNA polymerase sigma-70 factor (ECF subfamily) n=1 Tax=Chromohalobacter marismortui TaxID=42055 RepID=A0A4V3F425_9GAMM|nr:MULTISPECIES: RNA polymerase factor sigma-70 [Chromohalobacter]MCI0592389.1 RNA polymerase factor sigma-70 [Chromohalobacter sp.]TDU23566.1 RNA polymerase sigma-70 factor (ECF subfamily) [Chromohalobacter marismortui]